MRRDLFALAILMTAFVLLLNNGTSFFRYLAEAGNGFTSDLKVASTTLTLNVALILFGWRYYVDIQQEMQRRAESEERAALLASTDGMTALLNRKGFAEHGEDIRERAIEAGQHLAIISLQLNRFKTVNDRHGFDIGDEVLRRIAKHFSDIVGDDQPLARINGDEFAVITAFDSGDTERTKVLAQAMLDLATKPRLIDDKLVHVGAFVGIASANPAEVSIRDLLRRADIAQSEARTGRIGRPIWFDDGMERQLLAHTEIEQGIRNGLEHGQFIPYFEPQVDLATGRITGFEVLARWNHPLSGLIGPDQFIHVAEEHGLIGELSQIVIRSALAQAVNWDDHLTISVNIAPSQLADAWLAQKLVLLLTDTGFPAERLVVEITESSLFSDLDLAQAIVASLKNQGIKLALDDFGTGFSSLSHLRALPFDSIKIDRSFVSTAHEKPEADAVIRAVCTLADAIKTPVTVEGIENARTHAAMLGHGCTTGQGWYFGKPMSANQVDHLLRRQDEHQETPVGKSAQG